MRNPIELIEECKKHLRDTKQYQHEYKADIRKLITALDQALSLGAVVGRSEQLCGYCKKPLENTCCNECLEEMDNHNH